jgi:filamentous hemagglutinin
MDEFDAPADEPSHLNKYAYAGDNPVNNWDPSGNDFSLVDTLVNTAILGSIGATVGIGVNGVNNYAIGKPFFNGAAGAAAFGAAAVPLSVAFPVVGIALAGVGIYASGATAYQVFTSPTATAGQEGAAAFLVGLSLFGAIGAASNGASADSIWVNAKYFDSEGTSVGNLTSYQTALDNVKNYTGAIQDALSGTAQEGRITMAVGIAEDASGNRITLVGTSEPGGYIRPALRSVVYGWGGIVIKGDGHAAADIVAYAAAHELTLIGIGATRPICGPCAQEIANAGATAATELK